MYQPFLKNNSSKIELGLERITNFMAEIGNPHLRLPPTIHVAGTNGKGSTIAFLRAILEGNSKTCHIYTSPHLVKFNERIVLAGSEISDEYLAKILHEVEEKSKDHNLTYFELTTAAAFIAFASTTADYLLLETGLGGRLDATNIVPQKSLAIITPISLDHTEYLGNTLASIAYEKAGIVRDAHCIIAPQEAEALDYFRQNIANLEEAEILDLPNLPLVGAHQIINASVAIAAAKFLGYSDYSGIKNAKWPARLQKIRTIGGSFELWLDSAHNEGGAKTLAATISEPVYIICGMLKTKDATAFLQNLAGKIKRFYAVPIEGEPNCFTPNDLANIAITHKIPAKTAENIENAVADIVQSDTSGKIIICGSIYLAGKFLERNL